MVSKWHARELALLDTLDEQPRVAAKQTAWRVVRSDADPLECRSPGGRWDLGHFDVLYTSLELNGAVSEMYFHLSRQPVFPSTVSFSVSEIEIATSRTLRLTDMSELEALGVASDQYSGLLYKRTQEIGDAAAFLGFDGMIVPSARWDCLNFVIFCDNLEPHDIVLKKSVRIRWDEWRRKLDKKE